MPQITIFDVLGQAKVIDSAQGLQREIDLFEQRVDELIPLIESTNDAEAEQAVATYSTIQKALNAIVLQVPQFNQQLAAEWREQRKALAAQLRARRAARQPPR